MEYHPNASISGVMYCAYCGESFLHPADLENHIMSHAPTRTFKCSLCHFSYDRSDHLEHHFQQAHGLSVTPMPDLEASFRTPIACFHCAKAKTRCDKRIPCSRCISKGFPCQSRPTRRTIYPDDRNDYSLSGTRKRKTLSPADGAHKRSASSTGSLKPPEFDPKDRHTRSYSSPLAPASNNAGFAQPLLPATYQSHHPSYAQSARSDSIATGSASTLSSASISSASSYFRNPAFVQPALHVSHQSLPTLKLSVPGSPAPGVGTFMSADQYAPPFDFSYYDSSTSFRDPFKTPDVAPVPVQHHPSVYTSPEYYAVSPFDADTPNFDYSSSFPSYAPPQGHSYPHPEMRAMSQVAPLDLEPGTRYTTTLPDQSAPRATPPIRGRIDAPEERWSV